MKASTKETLKDIGIGVSLGLLVGPIPGILGTVARIGIGFGMSSIKSGNIWKKFGGYIPASLLSGYLTTSFAHAAQPAPAPEPPAMIVPATAQAAPALRMP